MNYSVKILKKVWLTHNVVQFVLERPKEFQCAPGDAVDVILDTGGTNQRSAPFTLTNMPDSAVLELIIKVYPNLKGFTHTISQRKVGDTLSITSAWKSFEYLVWLIQRKWNFAQYLGLVGNPFKALLFSIVATAPMFVGYYLAFDVNTEISLNQILISVIAAGFFEEVFFRGFLFGQLYRFTRLGFVPAIFFGALWFGAIHLYQGHDLISALGIFGITFLGAVLFGWLYIEWDNNLWVAIFSHTLMNLSWLLFSVDENAMGGWYANVFRIISIVLMVLLTIYSKILKDRSMEIGQGTLWIKNNS